MDKPNARLVDKIQYKQAVKAITDAPNLRDRFNAACLMCAHFQPIEGAMTNEGVCTLYDFATNMDYVCDSFEPQPPPAVIEQVAEALVEAADGLIAYGGEIKSLSDNHIGGYLVRFGSPTDTDAEGEYFDANTDYGFTKGESITSPVWLNHCQPMKTGSGKAVAVREPIGQSTLKMVDDGIVIDAILYEHAQYEKVLDKLGWSSGTADHTIKRKQNGKAIHIARWHLGLDASVTPKQAEPRNKVVSIKSLTANNQEAEAEAGVGQTTDQATPAPQATVTASDAVTTVRTHADTSTQAVKTAKEQKEMDEKELTAALAPLTQKIDEQGKELANMKAILKAEPPLNGVLVNGQIQVEPGQKLPYKSIAKVGTGYDMTGLGEQLKDIAQAAQGHGKSARLIASQDLARKNMKAALGINEEVGSEGGFLVQHDNAGWLAERAFEESQLAARCQQLTVGAGANGIKLNDWDETSRADGSHYGGMAAYWLNESGAYTGSQPQFRQIDLQLGKLTALYYATDEEMEDAVGLSSRISVAYPRVMRWKIDNAILRGTGGGQPTGVIGHGYTVSITKETGQAAATIVSANLSKMYSRMLGFLRGNAVWFYNQDIEQQLFGLTIDVGTGGQAVYMPANGLSAAPYGTIFGRPAIPLEQCSTLGTVGDIIFANFNDYLLAKKGEVQEASSIHVQFLTGQQVFRFTQRVTGQPAYSTALTPANGSNTLSAFVTLATRS